MIEITAKNIGALLRAEAVRYFLMEFGHANVVFTLIIAERHVGVSHKPQGFGFLVD